MNSSDPSKKLMGKDVTVKMSNKSGTVRGYDPASGKWWVVVSEAAWYTEEELKAK